MAFLMARHLAKAPGTLQTALVYEYEYKVLFLVYSSPVPIIFVPIFSARRATYRCEKGREEEWGRALKWMVSFLLFLFHSSGQTIEGFQTTWQVEYSH